LTLGLACSKSNNPPSNAIEGTWIFTNQSTFSYPYPEVLTNPLPFTATSSSTTVDSIKISFYNNGTYTFSNFKLPIDNGTYVIAQDSFLIIKPDTSGFVKYNYTLPLIYSFTGPNPPPAPPPYAGFIFTSDTILFKKSDNKTIAFSGVWLAKSNSPIIPSNDTIILNQCINYFKLQ
jgi:hypothetical protein